MADAVVGQYAKLRLIVGFLGEKEQLGWWDTAFLSATGIKYCEINFPRSAIAAAGTSVTEAARRLHDSRVGKGGVFHLFRLPPAVEESVHRRMMQIDAEEIAPIIATKELALKALEDLCVERIDVPEGPVQVGSMKTILHASSVEEVAKHYLDAFSTNKMTFPYFMDKTK